VLTERPYPTLLAPRPGAPAGAFPFSRYLLVGAGKHGASAMVAGLDHRVVKLRGSLIYRGGTTLIEVAPPIAVSAASEPADAVTDLGRVRFSGEIVDSKCYFGVMNPGNGKVHRDCAARCISGGIPPVFVAENGMMALLAGSDGRQLNHEVLDWVAEPITIEGRLLRSGDALVLETEPQSFVRGSGR
jgi:hypothetical protein